MQDEPIVPPPLTGSDLDTADSALRDNLGALEQRAAAVDEKLPWDAIQQLREIETDFAALRSTYEACRRGLMLRAMGWTDGPVLLGSGVELAAARLGVDTFDQQWHDVESAIDRRLSRSYAVAGLYLGLLSLVLGVMALVVSVRA